MVSKKWIFIIGFSLLCIACAIGVKVYSSSQPDNTLEFLTSEAKGGSITIKGKDIKIIEDIFLNEIEYAEENLSKEFPQSKSDYTVMCYLKNSEPEYEDFLLNFDFHKNPKKNEYVVMGNISGGQDRYGYIRGDAYDTLSSILKKYQNKKYNIQCC